MHDYSRSPKGSAVKAPVNEIYNLWTTPEGSRSGSCAVPYSLLAIGQPRERTHPVQIGDTYAWTWFGWPDDVAEHGTRDNMNGVHHFEFVFGKLVWSVLI